MKLIDLIIDQYERSSKWNNETSGNSSFRIEEKHYKQIGKDALIQQAKDLEAEHLLKIIWIRGYYNVDIEKVVYPLSHMEKFYQWANRKPKYKIVEEQRKMALKSLASIKSAWIKNYIESEILNALEKGRYESNEDKIGLLYNCLVGLDQLDAPVYKRAFSKRFLKNSKIFEEKLQEKVIRIARVYNDVVEETMEDTDVLSQLNIEEYSQELYIKGSLKLEVEGNFIDTGCFPYGTILNTQTLKKAHILDNPLIKKILTIENKANFMAEPYENGTLIIFSHGYFSPVEREFLIQLRDKLEGQQVTYLHSGDMDYGGVCIFRYIRNRIFPELKPYRMDIQTFDKYIGFGEPIKKSTLEKIKEVKEPLLQELIDRIVETELVIEQEAYL